ncbi:hypothetical protein SRABI96_00654 [Peribacillus sp. Bi96]|uniref:sulfotransferase family 2 domain-containing protein n=1 Tax=unclassified Peribacillus TaxID=2675266 RepID=UPI001D88F8D4|nr:sulfotransferase family 2 domain-containing protein [Peribacillus sp. Bi96]CAH0148633.1 hypothetical protein SRABI96_00654 [Peribacillus sp. Bi96]
MSEDHLDIFMHVPKTGGTTLSAIFRKQYQVHEIFDHDSYESQIKKVDQLGAEEKRKIKAVAGHYYYGIHQHFSKPSNYFTMLRDPVDRVISLYFFLQNQPGYERVRDMTLEEFVLKDPEAQNLQTRLVCGNAEEPDIEIAKENLKTFSVVGVTELFNETLFCLKKEYAWGDIHYTRKNITKNRLAKDEVPSELINLIKTYNAWDIELYDLAKQLLNDKLQSLTEDEQNQLKKFNLEQST